MTPKSGGAKKKPAPAKRKPAAAPLSPAARIRELQAEVRRLRTELALAAREDETLVEETVVLAPGPVPPIELDPAIGRKTPTRPLEEEEEPFEDYDEEADFLAPTEGMPQRRRELDRERADRELELGDEAYWWVCPKCGEHLSEHEFDNIKVERCESCGGVTIDRAEIDQLLLFSEVDHALAVRIRGLLQ
jgi:hypothetical protein